MIYVFTDEHISSNMDNVQRILSRFTMGLCIYYILFIIIYLYLYLPYFVQFFTNSMLGSHF